MRQENISVRLYKIKRQMNKKLYKLCSASQVGAPKDTDLYVQRVVRAPRWRIRWFAAAAVVWKAGAPVAARGSAATATVVGFVVVVMSEVPQLHSGKFMSELPQVYI